MRSTITLIQRRAPHALDLLENGSLFYWGADTKEAWYIDDLLEGNGAFVMRRVAPEGTNSLLNYTDDDYEVWVDGGSVNIVGLLVWGTSTEHNDQSGEPGGDEIVADGDSETITDQLGRVVLVDTEGTHWTHDKETGCVVRTRLFGPYARTLKTIPSSSLTRTQRFYLTEGGRPWVTNGITAHPAGFPACEVFLIKLPLRVFVDA